MASVERSARLTCGIWAVRLLLIGAGLAVLSRMPSAVIAQENSPRPTAPAKLSEREQQVAALAALGRSNKVIAYELGISHSTVRVLLWRACSRVGARTRSELM